MGFKAWLWQLRINLKRNFKKLWKQLRPRLLPYLLIVVTLLVGFGKSYQIAWIKTLGLSSLITTFLYYLFQLLSTDASQRVATLFTAPDYRTDLGFMGRIKEDLEGFCQCLPKNCKTIVFIDDLDRCDPRKAVEVLEAIKLLRFSADLWVNQPLPSHSTSTCSRKLPKFR